MIEYFFLWFWSEIIPWQVSWALVLSCHTFCVLCCFSTNYPDPLLWKLRSALNLFKGNLERQHGTIHNKRQKRPSDGFFIGYFLDIPRYTCSLMIRACANKMFPDGFPRVIWLVFDHCVLGWGWWTRAMASRQGEALVFFPEPAPFNVHPNMQMYG